MIPPGTEADIRVLIVDDHALVRDGMARQLTAAGGIQVVGTCGTVREALDLTAEHVPGVVLLDYDLDGETGAAFMAGAKKLELNSPVLVVTGWVSDPELRRLVRLGVMGVITKNEPAETLVRAVRSVARGEPWFDAEEVAAMVRGREQEEFGPLSQQLSVREKIAVRCLLQGLTNKEIGSELGISEASTKAVLQRLFDRAGVRNRSQLVRVALERGWG